MENNESIEDIIQIELERLGIVADVYDFVFNCQIRFQNQEDENLFKLCSYFVNVPFIEIAYAGQGYEKNN